MGILGLSEIMDKAVDSLKRYIKTTILFSLAFGAIFMVIGIILAFIAIAAVSIGAVFMAVTLKNLPMTMKAKSTIGIAIILIIIVMVVMLFVVSFTLCSNVGILRIASQDFFDETVGISTALGDSFKNIHKVFGLVFSIGVLFLPVMAIFCGLIYIVYSGLKSVNFTLIGGNPAKLIVVIISITVLFLIFTFVLLIYITLFSFSLNVLILEKKGIISSLKRSVQLVRKNFWKIYGCNVLFGLTISALKYSLSSVIILFLSIIYLILKALNVHQNFLVLFSMIYSYANWPIGIISWLIINPLGITMMNLLYFNQRFKKEGFDISLKLKQIQKIKEKEQLSGNIQFNKSV